MIEFTGHRLDAVGRAHRRRRGDRQRLLQRAQVEGRADDTEDVIRRRQEVYAEQTAPLIERLPRAGHPARGRRHGRGRGRHPADLRRAGRHPRELSDSQSWPSSSAGSRSRRPSRSRACARPAWSSGETLELLRSSVRAGITTGELDAIAEDNIRSSGATPSFQGYHAFPGRSAPRSTTRSCTASRATGCRRRAT